LYGSTTVEINLKPDALLLANILVLVKNSDHKLHCAVVCGISCQGISLNDLKVKAAWKKSVILMSVISLQTFMVPKSQAY
jgi:hypothetical protein